METPKVFISVTTVRVAGLWMATAYVNGKVAASCSCQNKKIATDAAREDAAAFAARICATPASSTPASSGRQGGAVKVGPFSMYLQRLGSDADVLRNAAPVRVPQLASTPALMEAQAA